MMAEGRRPWSISDANSSTPSMDAFGRALRRHGACNLVSGPWPWHRYRDGRGGVLGRRNRRQCHCWRTHRHRSRSRHWHWHRQPTTTKQCHDNRGGGRHIPNAIVHVQESLFIYYLNGSVARIYISTTNRSYYRVGVGSTLGWNEPSWT